MESNPFFERIMWILIMLGIPLIIYGISWLVYWLRNYYSQCVYDTEVRKGHESKNDNRMPVLYLRNFKADGSKIENSEINVPNVKFKLNLPTLEARDVDLNQENLLRREVSPIGPLISIGDFNPADIGIERIKSNDKQWKTDVEKYMIISSMIILRTSSGITPGITWELSMILNGFLNKTLFFVESSDSELMHELDRQLKLKFPNNKQKEINDRIVPYYFWVTENGKKNYPFWLRNSSFFKKLLNDSKKQKSLLKYSIKRSL